MGRSFKTWGAFLLFVAIVLGAMGWVSTTVLRLESEAAATQREAQIEEAWVMGRQVWLRALVVLCVVAGVAVRGAPSWATSASARKSTAATVLTADLVASTKRATRRRS